MNLKSKKLTIAFALLITSTFSFSTYSQTMEVENFGENIEEFLENNAHFSENDFQDFAKKESLFGLMKEIEIRNLLGPFPASGSNQEKLEVLGMFTIQKIRTSSQCQRAHEEDETSLESFFVAHNGPITLDEAKNAKGKFFKHMLKAGTTILFAKKLFNRPRPYDSHSKIKPCVPLERTTSYPSGHAALSRYYARLLGEMYPDKKDALLNRAQEIANNRVLGGVHYPSDIAAGIKLGDALYDREQARK